MNSLKKAALIFAGVYISSISYGAFNGLSHHSRANCVNNESISWDWTTNWKLWVRSDHLNLSNGKRHVFATGWQTTWRAAAVHWGEGRGGWSVYGMHYMVNRSGKSYLAQEETVVDCSIYNGWWDKNK